MITRQQKNNWVAALRSGKYKMNKSDKLCDYEGCSPCGVLADMLAERSHYTPHGVDFVFNNVRRRHTVPHELVPMKYQIPINRMHRKGVDVLEIADYISATIDCD